MAILAILTGDVSKAQYEALRAEADWEGNHPEGGIFHAAGFDENGRFHAADIWESIEAMNAFFEQRLRPGFERMNIPELDVAILPAHNINAFRAVEQHLV